MRNFVWNLRVRSCLGGSHSEAKLSFAGRKFAAGECEGLFEERISLSKNSSPRRAKGKIGFPGEVACGLRVGVRAGFLNRAREIQEIWKKGHAEWQRRGFSHGSHRRGEKRVWTDGGLCGGCAGTLMNVGVGAAGKSTGAEDAPMPARVHDAPLRGRILQRILQAGSRPRGFPIQHRRRGRERMDGTSAADST